MFSNLSVSNRAVLLRLDVKSSVELVDGLIVATLVHQLPSRHRNVLIRVVVQLHELAVHVRLVHLHGAARRSRLLVRGRRLRLRHERPFLVDALPLATRQRAANTRALSKRRCRGGRSGKVQSDAKNSEHSVLICSGPVQI